MKNTDLKIALVDKSKFPRDKVCGDAIGGRVKHVLNRIDPAYTNRLASLAQTTISAGWSLTAPNRSSIDLEFVNHGYVAKREHFDDFLLDLVKEKANTHIIENFSVKKIAHRGELIVLQNEKAEMLSTKLVIACDGAQSVVAKQLAGFKIDLKHYSGAVRAYYTNIGGIKNKHAIEIHLIKEYLPGYFWIFPLDEHRANVGFGMLSDNIRKKKIDLKSAFQDIISSSPGIADRFKDAEIEGTLEGFGLPLGGKKRPISGNGYMLCGDAASLIDPLNGEGIGNAMWSGHLAAIQAERCFSENDFSAAFMDSYDEAVYRKLGTELRSKLFMQKIFNRTWLINSLVRIAILSPGLKNWFGKRL